MAVPLDHQGGWIPCFHLISGINREAAHYRSDLAFSLGDETLWQRFSRLHLFLSDLLVLIMTSCSSFRPDKWIDLGNYLGKWRAILKIRFAMARRSISGREHLNFTVQMDHSRGPVRRRKEWGCGSNKTSAPGLLMCMISSWAAGEVVWIAM